MKIRPSIIWFIVIVAVMITAMLWYGKKKPAKLPPVSSVETNTVPPVATASSAPVNAPIQSTMPMVQTTKGTNSSKTPPLSKVARAIGLLSDYNDVPIVFYGKIEDQFSNTVAGAQVNFDVRVMNGYESTVNRGQVISDANGLFTISGYKGQDLGMAVKKDGYVLVSMNGSSIYSHLYPEEQRAHPDQNNPTVIKMWKLQGAESLVSIDQHYKLPCPGAPVNFDLLAGQIVPSGGDIKITVNRPGGVISGRNPQDWSVQVEAVNGGLIETSVGEARVTYAAPDNGYEPSKTFAMSNSNNTWYEAVHQMFFVQSRNGQVYGKINLSLRINQNPDDSMSITLSGVASANGSRNWEATAPQQ